MKFYDDLTNLNCVACDYTCKNCNGTTNTDCLTCNTNFLVFRWFKDGIFPIGECLCLVNYYDDGSGNETCLPCHYSCKNCLDNAVANCIECNTNNNENRYYPTENPLNGPCLCNEFYYDNNANESCLACHYSCSVCNGILISSCTNCGINGTTHRTMTTTSCPCDVGYFD